MQMRAAVWTGSVTAALLAVSVGGCSTKPKQPPAPPRQLAVEEQVAQAHKSAEVAGERAASAVRDKAPEQADPQRVEKQAAAARAEAAQREMQKGAADVAVVPWQRLNLFVPEQIGSYRALGSVQGRDHQGPGPRVAAVRRMYESGTKRASVQITDALIARVLHAPFDVSASINQETDNGFRRSIKVKQQPAILEWRAKESSSRVAILVGARFVVDVRVSKATAGTDAQDFAEAMNLATLGALNTLGAAGAPNAPNRPGGPGGKVGKAPTK